MAHASRLGQFMKDPVWCGGGVVVWWCGFLVIIIPTPVWVFDLDFDWGVAINSYMLTERANKYIQPTTYNPPVNKLNPQKQNR